MEMIMSPQTMFSLMSSIENDFNIQDSYTLEEAIDMVEFQESLVVDDIDWEEVVFEVEND